MPAKTAAARPPIRFRHAQDRSGAYRKALREIKRGVKETHWMWFIFPQHRGLAKSETARHFGIASKAEAQAFIDDPVLRSRLFQCTMGVLAQDKLMFGDTDRRKLRACMTLFRTVVPDPAPLNAVLSKFYGGIGDPLTIDLLAGKKIVLPQTRPTVRWEQPSLLRAPADAEPWSRRRVTAYVRSLGLTALAADELVDAWMTDRGRAMGAAWAAREEAAWQDRQAG